MSTLFFDGFDRGYLLKTLDSNYWSQQLPNLNYPRYSFGAYTYNTDLAKRIGNTVYRLNFYTSSKSPQDTLYPVIRIQNYNEAINYKAPTYPGVGSPPGFLALNNISINNPNNLTPLTYLQLSGFAPIQGSQSYFGIRCLGIETKDTSANDANVVGRFGSRHPFLAFCSGNTTGLLLSFVRLEHENLLNLRVENDSNNFTGPKWSIGLQAEQNDGISGIFDMNIADSVANYRITPIYWESNSSDIGGIPSNIFDEIQGPQYINQYFTYSRILTIATDREGIETESRFASVWRVPYHRVISRWTHFEINIDHLNGLLQIKAEDVDLLVFNTGVADRSEWEFTIPISGFYYDNVRIFNRTYNSGILSSAVDGYNFQPISSDLLLNNDHYYANGSLTLIDDVTLVDNTGNQPKFFLGKDSKVLPLNPGFIAGTTSANSELFKDFGSAYDGPYQWDKFPLNLTQKSILSTYDFDSSKISQFKSNKINSNLYSNNYASGIQSYGDSYETKSTIELNSLWRYSYNDAIGGIKVYNFARKEFLDSSYTNIISKKSYGEHDLNTRYLLHFDEDDLIDYSWYGHDVDKVGDIQNISNAKFNSGLSLKDSSYVVITDESYSIGTSEFTLESWIKFTSNSDNIVLFDKKYKPELANFYISGIQNPSYASSFSSFLVQEWIRPRAYSFSIDTGSLYIKSWYNYVTEQFASSSSQIMCDTPAMLEFKLPQSISTGSWHHIAITKNNINDGGYFTVFLDGVSGDKYTIHSLFPDAANICPPTGNPISSSGILYIKHPSMSIFNFWEFDALSRSFGNLLSTYVEQSSNSLKNFPYVYIYGSGDIDEYRFSSGIVRYSSNFTPQATAHTGAFDGFIEIGPQIDLNRTIYKNFQFYQMYRPDTQDAFDMNDLRDGFRLGVKKL